MRNYGRTLEYPEQQDIEEFFDLQRALLQPRMHRFVGNPGEVGNDVIRQPKSGRYDQSLNQKCRHGHPQVCPSHAFH